MGGKTGAPKGSTNAAYPGMWRDALRRVCARDRGTIDRVARALIKAAQSGDVGAIKEFGDRMDGKATAHVELSGSVKIEETFAQAVKSMLEKPKGNPGIKIIKSRVVKKDADAAS